MSRRHRYKTALPHRPRRSRCSCPARLHRKRPIGTPRPWRRWRRAVASTTQSRNHTHIRQRRESAVATRLALAKAATLARGGIGSVVTTHVIYWARNSLAEFVLLWKDFAAPSAATPLAGAVTGRIAAERSPIRGPQRSDPRRNRRPLRMQRRGPLFPTPHTSRPRRSCRHPLGTPSPPPPESKRNQPVPCTGRRPHS